MDEDGGPPWVPGSPVANRYGPACRQTLLSLRQRRRCKPSPKSQPHSDDDGATQEWPAARGQCSKLSAAAANAEVTLATATPSSAAAGPSPKSMRSFVEEQWVPVGMDEPTPGCASHGRFGEPTSGFASNGSIRKPRPPAPLAMDAQAHYHASMQLAVAGPSREFLTAAEVLYTRYGQDGDPDCLSLPELSSSPRFNEALFRQGVAWDELGPHSLLTEDRRVRLLASVLQERAYLMNIKLAPVKGGRALKHQTKHELIASLDRERMMQDHRDAVYDRYLGELQNRALQAQADAQAEAERAERVRHRDEALLYEARMRTLGRAEHVRNTALTAAEQEEQRRLDKMDAIQADNDRCNKAVERRDRERGDHLRRLRDHSEKVLATAYNSKRDEAEKCLELAAHLEREKQRRDDHIRACEAQRQANLALRHAKEQDYEHQVERVRRIQQSECVRRHVEAVEDQHFFQECKALRREPVRSLEAHLHSMPEPNYLSGVVGSTIDPQGESYYPLLMSLSSPSLLRDALTTGNLGVARMLRQQWASQE